MQKGTLKDDGFNYVYYSPGCIEGEVQGLA